ncbi:MAG: hypothetical protein EOP06_21505 [Proteobacteria bacterium]|nr:MAG: hypothetical protein EOP06_21505 [Pseudomonadota bacterium]
MKSLMFIAGLLLPFLTFAQSDIDKMMRGGELLLGGLTIFKAARSTDKKSDSKSVESVCVKNKLAGKITFRLTGLDLEDNEIRKEVVVQTNGKECLFNVWKTIYTYEIVLSTGEIYKKGEYKLEDAVTFTVKDP